MLQNLVTCIPFLFGYKNWDSSLSTETGYIQDGQVSVTSKGSVFSVCHDIQATLGSTQSPPLHIAKQPLHGTLHHSTTHMHGKYYLCHNTLNVFNVYHLYIEHPSQKTHIFTICTA